MMKEEVFARVYRGLRISRFTKPFAVKFLDEAEKELGKPYA
jgi:hypothetical protein